MEPDTFYHIYNRGNNREKIFFTRDNYIFFLTNFDKYLSEILNVYSYCLLPNHFHLLIKTKSELEISKIESKLKCENKIAERFKIFFMKYAKAINKQEVRTGSLFENSFEKKNVTTVNYLIRVILYIHLNPFHHHFCADYESYEWSSYNRLLDNRPTKLMKDEVLNLFGGKENFINLHIEKRDILILNEFENV